MLFKRKHYKEQEGRGKDENRKNKRKPKKNDVQENTVETNEK